MAVELAKDAIDLGIVVRDGQKSLAFYRDLLGFRHEATTPMPGGATMERLWCGNSMIKVVIPSAKRPVAEAAPGGIQGAYGYRYWTMIVKNLDEIMAKCEEAGVKIAVPKTEVRPGVSIGIVEDPDGNWVEFVAG